MSGTSMSLNEYEFLVQDAVAHLSEGNCNGGHQELTKWWKKHSKSKQEKSRRKQQVAGES